MSQPTQTYARRGRIWAKVLLCEIGGGIAAFGVVFLAGKVLAVGLPLPTILLVAGVLAALLGYAAKLPRWWLVVQALFPLAAGAALWLALPTWIYLLAFILLLSLQWNAARGGVPLYLTNRRTHTALENLLPEKPYVTVADLGSGLGGTLLALARARPDGRFVGIETAPLPYAVSRLLVVLSGLSSRVSFIYGDYRRQDLSTFDVVYCFLSPVPMPDVHAKARLDMRPGTMLISNSFTVPGHPADEIVAVTDARGTQLHIWRF